MAAAQKISDRERDALISDFMERIDREVGAPDGETGYIEKLERLGFKPAAVVPFVETLQEIITAQHLPQTLSGLLMGDRKSMKAGALMPTVAAFTFGAALGRSYALTPPAANGSGGTLDHVYNGPSRKIVDGLPEEEAQPTTGAFRVVRRGEGFAVLGNGEAPEDLYLVTRPEALERVDAGGGGDAG